MTLLNDQTGNTDPPLRAALYIRVSTTMQQDDGRSPQSQQEDMADYCRRQGWPVVKIYREEAVSGRLSRRPALQALLRDARDGQFDIVMVYYISRFYRKLESLLTTLRYLDHCGVTFVSYNEKLDFTNRWGKLILSVLGALAEIYVDELSETTSRGKEQRARDGLFNGSLPTGYCNGRCNACTDPNGPGYCPRVGQSPLGEGRVPVPHPLESQAVKLAFEWYASGRYSDADIAWKLNQARATYDGQEYPLRPKRKPGDRKRYGAAIKFGHETVREILNRKFYTGQVPYTGGHGVAEERRKFREPQAYYRGQHPPLIEQAQYTQVQHLRRQRRFGGVRGNPKRVYLLSGLLKSWPGGSKMRGVTNGSGTRYYRDVARIGRSRLNPEPAAGQPNVPAEGIEQQAFDLFRHLRLPPEWQQRILGHLIAGDDEGLAELARQRRHLLAKADNLHYLLLQNHITRQQHEHELARLESELARLEQPSGLDAGHLQALLDHPAHLWAQATPLELKTLFSLVFQTVYVQQLQLVGADIHVPFREHLPVAPVPAAKKEAGSSPN
ncbi:MAG: hypothetical protein Kow0031_31720 [Anaerolineae bacterium]